MIGRLDAVEEVLTAPENNDVEDAVFVSTSVVGTVVLKCCIVPVAEASGTDVEIIPETVELLLKGKVVADDEKLASEVILCVMFVSA